jgi:redox-sensitive bicupin YhaK (pirin superfamily)
MPDVRIRRGRERGLADHGWLRSRHTFSFADYFDPAHMGFRSLRVINDDIVAPGGGFGGHPHREMEIVSYVLEGALEHRDSMGTGSVIRPGDVQRMSAGTGVRHSEYNASKTEPVHFLQIWIVPSVHDVPPSYEQKTFADDEKRGKKRLVASNDGREGSVTLQADADLFAAILGDGERIEHTVAAGRGAWVHVARGAASVDGQRLEAGDAASTEAAGALVIQGLGSAEVLIFDLA